MKKLIGLFLILLCLAGCNTADKHHHIKCSQCGLCISSDCDKQEEKCQGHEEIHTHIECEICGKCIDENCTELDEAKCKGHKETHTHIKCEICNKCIDENCNSSEEEKCPGHEEIHTHIKCETCSKCIKEDCNLSKEEKCLGCVRIDLIDKTYISHLYTDEPLEEATYYIINTYNEYVDFINNNSIMEIKLGDLVDNLYQDEYYSVLNNYNETFFEQNSLIFFNVGFYHSRQCLISIYEVVYVDEEIIAKMTWAFNNKDVNLEGSIYYNVEVSKYVANNYKNIECSEEKYIHPHIPCNQCGKCIEKYCDGLDAEKCPKVHIKKLKELYDWYFELEFLGIKEIKLCRENDYLIVINTSNNKNDFTNLLEFFNQDVVENLEVDYYIKQNPKTKLVIKYGMNVDGEDAFKQKELCFYNNIIEIDNIYYNCDTSFIETLSNDDLSYMFDFEKENFAVFDKQEEFVTIIENIKKFEFKKYDDFSYNINDYSYYIITPKGLMYIYDERVFSFDGVLFEIQSNERFNFYNSIENPIIIEATLSKVNDLQDIDNLFEEKYLENHEIYSAEPSWLKETYDISIYEARRVDDTICEISIVKDGVKESTYGYITDNNENAIQMICVADINKDGYIEVMISCTHIIVKNKCLIFDTYDNSLYEFYIPNSHAFSYTDGQLYMGKYVIQSGRKNNISLKDNILVHQGETFDIALFFFFSGNERFNVVYIDEIGKQQAPLIFIYSKAIYKGEEFYQKDNESKHIFEDEFGPVPVFIDDTGRRVLENTLLGPDVLGTNHVVPGTKYQFGWILIAYPPEDDEEDKIKIGFYDMEIHFGGKVEVIEDFLEVR